jgi:hypothetical protein
MECIGGGQSASQSSHYEIQLAATHLEQVIANPVTRLLELIKASDIKDTSTKLLYERRSLTGSDSDGVSQTISRFFYSKFDS